MRLRWIEPEEIQYSQESPAVVRRRAERLLVVLEPYVGQELTADVLKQLVQDVKEVLSHATVKKVVEFELRNLILSRMTGSLRLKLALAIAGGYRQARAGKAIGFASPQHPPVSCHMRIENIFPSEIDETAVVLLMRICNGVFAGQSIKAELRLKKIMGWGRLLGANNYRKGCKITRLNQFIRLVCTGVVERVDNSLVLQGVSVVPANVDANRRLTTLRFRSAAPCFYGADGDCRDCGVGPNQCSRSCEVENTNYKLKVVSDGRAYKGSRKSG